MSLRASILKVITPVHRISPQRLACDGDLDLKERLLVRDMTNGKAAAQDNNPIIPHEFQAACSERTANRRPKLLFLAHAFPPVRAIGCVRTWNTAKYLARLGWEITVVTPEPSVWRYVEDTQKVEQLEQEGIRRILTNHRWRWLSPDPLRCWNEGLGWIVGGVCRRAARYLGVDDEIGWIRPTKQACSVLTAEDVDVILATGSPFVAFTLAKWLSDRLDRPYVLDYRDPWTENPHADALTMPATLTMRKEAMLLAGCTAVTIVSRSWGSAMAQRFDLGPKLHVITNGYDPEELAEVEPHNFGHFAIVYTGIFYPPKRVITPVMAALKRLKEISNGHNAEWYFHYYGDGEAHVREEADRFGIMDRVVLHGRVSRTEALSAVRGSSVSVVITSVFAEDTQGDKGIVTGKLFELLGLGTPILLIAPPGSDATQIVDETGMGRAFDGTDIEGIVQFLSSIAQTEPNKRSACADRYSWPVLAAKLDRILRGVIAPR